MIKHLKQTGQDNWRPRKPLTEAERFRLHGPVEPLEAEKLPLAARIAFVIAAGLGCWAVIALAFAAM